MMHNRLAMTAVAAFALLSVVGAAVAVRSRPEREKPRRESATVVRTASVDPEPAAIAPDTAPLQKKIDGLQTEVAELQRRLAQIESRPSPSRENSGGFRMPARADAAQVLAWQTIAMDASKSEAERVEALMRMRITPSDPDGRTPEVVASMLTLLETSTDAKIRADICRHVKRYVPLEMSAPLMRVMSRDGDERVRQEAAETLGPLKADPSIAAALEHAAKNDPSERVRRQAESSLRSR